MSAAEFGSFIHQIFEDGVNKSIDDLVAIAKKHRSNYTFKGAKYTNVQVNICLANFCQLNKKLEETIGEELVFEVPVCESAGITSNGIIDRIVRGKEGGYLVIDYKTGRREKSKMDLYTDRQLKGYAYAAHKLYNVPYNKIHCALYYPLTNNLVSIQYTEVQMNAYVREFIEQVWTIRKKKAGDYPAIRNEFCSWCNFKSLCSKFNDQSTIDKRLDEINEAKRAKK